MKQATSTQQSSATRLLQWYDRYAIGIEDVDEEHKKLLAMINLLLVGLRMEDVNGANMALNELLLYTKYHFEHEEMFLEREGYSKLNSHKKLHENMIKQIIGLKLDFRGGLDEKLYLQTADTLRAWLYDHIQNHDKAYAQELKRLGKL
uniref:Putative bacteriohemerythrin n=1 Tax=Magnetococcus massalia (strain MO-1) TaxID=451514 RepID=A0A1S7LFM2_MAGMO|nr:Putative bacteriohemerythrin [Candidatus Magnetococcus massalia]